MRIKLAESKNRSLLELSFLLLWVLIIVPKVVAMAFTMILSVFLWRKFRSKRKSTICVLLFSLGIVQLLAIATSLTYLPFDLERVVAGINTSFVWICSAGLFELFRSRYVSLVRIGKFHLINLAILAGLGLIAFAQYRFNAFAFLPAMHITDWINGESTFRLLCLMDYSNCIPIFVMLCLPCSLIYLRNRFKKAWGLCYLLLFAVSFALIYFSNSRISLFAFAVFVFICGFLLLRKRGRLSKSFMVLLFIGIAIFALLRLPAILDLVDRVLNSRVGSNNMRMSIYTNGIQTALKYNPVYGVGVKIMHNGYPLGSHSTVIGAFYKTGFIGLLLLFLILFYAIRNRVTGGHKIVGICLLSLLIVFFLEDMDGSNWIAMFFFSLLGITQVGKASPVRKLMHSQERKLL